MRRPFPFLPILTLSLLFVGGVLACGESHVDSDEPTAATEEATESTPVDTSAATAATAPPVSGAGESFEPVTSRDGLRTEGRRMEAAGLAFALPANWEAETPSSSMRLAQASIPGPGGPAELTVFHFGPGGGGGVDANLERWAGQVEPDAGSSPIRDRFDQDGLTVHWIEVSGTLKPSTMGTGPREPQPDSRLLGAVIEGPGGPWFFKATGPDATLGAARTDFVDMLKTAEVGR